MSLDARIVLPQLPPGEVVQRAKNYIDNRFGKIPTVKVAEEGVQRAARQKQPNEDRGRN